MSNIDPKLKDFLEDYSGFDKRLGPIEKLQYQNISTDTRSIKAGQFFIPLRGENFDGHEFVQDAIAKKASAIAIQSNWYSEQEEMSFPKDLTVIVVENTLDFLQKLSAWHRSHFDISIIAITGSNGKTTLRKMVADLLANKYEVLTSEGNQNNHIGVPLTLLKIQSVHEIAVIEMGTNHPGEITMLTQLVNPTIGIITNIGKGHIGYFGSLEAIYQEKTALFDNMKTGSIILKNMEDGFLRKYQREAVEMINVGTSEKNDYWGRIISLNRLGCLKFSINHRAEIQLKIPGIHHFQNALMASAIAMHLDITIDHIVTTLQNFEPVNQRMQVYEENNVLIVNDAYNANPDSTRAAIDYLANLRNKRGKKILALGDMLEMGHFGEQEHLTVGKYVNGKPIDFVFLFGPLSTRIKEGILQTNSFKGEIYWYETHEEIADHLKKILAPNDVLLVKGSRGMKMENVLNNLFGKN